MNDFEYLIVLIVWGLFNAAVGFCFGAIDDFVKHANPSLTEEKND